MSINGCNEPLLGPGTRVTLGTSIRVAALLLLSSIALSMLSPAYISPDIVRRLNMALMGCLVVAYANVIPKVLTPAARFSCSPAQNQAIRRFTGWSLVLGGIGYTLAALFAPLDMVMLLACASLATALLVAVLRFVWLVAGNKRD